MRARTKVPGVTKNGARDLPPDLQPWGDAMMAELPAVDGVVSPILWALGGGVFLSKALFVRALTGNGLRRKS